MPINWSNRDTMDRLWAAVLASGNHTINYNEVARIFGQGATYNTVECQLRKFKKAAASLKKEASGREGPAPSPAKSRAKKTDVKVTKNGVKTGRVTKAKAKAKAGGKVKKEMSVESEGDDVVDTVEGGAGRDSKINIDSEDEDNWFV
ncbi:hypothetical protein P153DRAFT_367629 [Dothidotthia symphoricarpi CBS 119687]|uniref:Uncharacterized protein n=1 Tax=Dothidotthia symphoricarpi CBS 119687 TaxID=1392245 RepID=A0A6A6ABG7_9PLEO|nr:uncharacterized protein P153DRAFT_367629 [Dothidotthia symphoricarpi CBS 119687]KAF2128505.1 hypothetical protein P153DRAFT_367629 [Dothidotthia symphoricarpi CBS 119687]